jgi:hypothetical protein
VAALVLVAAICLANPGAARESRPDQLPNGNVFLCASCHIPQGRSGPLNAFGELVQARFLNRAGDVLWGRELASLDADGDGYTNGEELGDPEGTWRRGEPDPGDPAQVTRPWDADSPGSVVSAVRSWSWAALKAGRSPE